MYRNDALRRAIAKLGCTVSGCGAPPPSQAAHGNQGKGMSLKSPDWTLFAACPACHRRIDQGKELTQSQRRYMTQQANLATLQQLVARGILVVADE